MTAAAPARTVWATVPFTAPCPGCGRDVGWASRLVYLLGATWVETTPEDCRCARPHGS